MRKKMLARDSDVGFLIVSGDTVLGVTEVATEFHYNTTTAAEFGSFDSAKQFCGLTGKHGTDE
jgi:hypothetical protein